MVQAMFFKSASVAPCLPVVPAKEPQQGYDCNRPVDSVATKLQQEGEVPPSTCSVTKNGLSYALCYPDQDVDDGNANDGLRDLLESSRKQGGLSKSKRKAKTQRADQERLQAEINDCIKVLSWPS